MVAPSVCRRRVPACMRCKRSSDSVACDPGQREPSDVCGHQRGDCKRGCRSSSFQAQPAHFRFSPDSGHIAASHRSATKSADARRGAADGGELRQAAGAAAPKGMRLGANQTGSRLPELLCCAAPWLDRLAWGNDVLANCKHSSKCLTMYRPPIPRSDTRANYRPREMRHRHKAVCNCSRKFRRRFPAKR